MATDNQIEHFSTRKAAATARDITYCHLKECFGTLLNGVDVPEIKTVELSNVQQCLKHIPLNDKQRLIQAWNAWIAATAQYQYALFQSRTSPYGEKSHRLRVLAVSIFICALALWIDLNRPGAFSNAVLMALGVAVASLAAFGANCGVQSKESLVRAKLRARAVAWHITGWQLNSTGDAFLGEIYPWKYDSLGLRLNAPKIRMEIPR